MRRVDDNLRNRTKYMRKVLQICDVISFAPIATSHMRFY